MGICCIIFCSVVLQIPLLHGAFFDIKPNIQGPPMPNRPFVVAWDVPSENCAQRYGVDLDLKDFDIIHNTNKGWQGDRLVIFYGHKLGLYPTFTRKGIAVNGGLPQCCDLNNHIDKATSDITVAIPDENFQGLAVIDWEGWFIDFDRTEEGRFETYFRNKSIEKVKQEHPDWPYEKQVALARFEFNTAARLLFQVTLKLGKLLRPKALWGYFRFPNCFNYDKAGKDLSCSVRTMELNDEQEWLYDESTALYPSVYMAEVFKDKRAGLEYVKNRIKESMRLDGARKSNISIPIFPYHMISYRSETKFLDKRDLMHTIGIAALLGTSGMVIWGGYNVANSTEECISLKKYVDYSLGPFCRRMSQAASKCSRMNCRNHGRCVMSSRLLHGASERRHLTTFEAEDILGNLNGEVYKVFDQRISTEKFMKQYEVTCQCYIGWSGNDCSIPFY